MKASYFFKAVALALCLSGANILAQPNNTTPLRLPILQTDGNGNHFSWTNMASVVAGTVIANYFSGNGAGLSNVVAVTTNAGNVTVGGSGITVTTSNGTNVISTIPAAGTTAMVNDPGNGLFGDWAYVRTLFSLGPPGSYDAGYIRCATSKMYHGKTYVWYGANDTGNSGDNKGTIAMLVGSDFYHLTKMGPVIQPSGAYSNHIQGPRIYDGDLLNTGYIYLVAFGGTNIGFEHPRNDIFLFRSTDATTWTVMNGGAPILQQLDQTKWDGYTLWRPFLLKNNNLYYLYFNAAGTNNTFHEMIGFATATNIAGPYTEYAGNPVVDNTCMVADPSIIRLADGTWVMNYISVCFQGPNNSILWSQSTDLTNWVPVASSGIWDIPTAPPFQGPEIFMSDGPAFLGDDTTSCYLMRPRSQAVEKFLRLDNPIANVSSAGTFSGGVSIDRFGLNGGFNITNRIAGVKLWVKADAITNITSGNAYGVVTNWSDYSGNGLNFTNPVGAGGTYLTNYLNRLPSLRFNQFNPTIFRTAPTSFTSGNVSFLAVCARNWSVAKYAPLWSHGYYDKTGQAFFGTEGPLPVPPQDWVAGMPGFFGNGYVSTNKPRAFGFGFSTPSLPDGQFAVVSGTLGTNAAHIWLNSTLMSTIEQTGTVLATNAPIELCIAGLTGDVGDYWVSELILVDGVMTDSIRQEAEGYLAHKWGLANNLDDSNPFKRAFGVATLVGNNAFLGSNYFGNIIIGGGNAAGVTNMAGTNVDFAPGANVTFTTNGHQTLINSTGGGGGGAGTVSNQFALTSGAVILGGGNGAVTASGNMFSSSGGTAMTNATKNFPLTIDDAYQRGWHQLTNAAGTNSITSSNVTVRPTGNTGVGFSSDGVNYTQFPTNPPQDGYVWTAVGAAGNGKWALPVGGGGGAGTITQTNWNINQVYTVGASPIYVTAPVSLTGPATQLASSGGIMSLYADQAGGTSFVTLSSVTNGVAPGTLVSVILSGLLKAGAKYYFTNESSGTGATSGFNPLGAYVTLGGSGGGGGSGGTFPLNADTNVGGFGLTNVGYLQATGTVIGARGQFVGDGTGTGNGTKVYLGFNGRRTTYGVCNGSSQFSAFGDVITAQGAAAAINAPTATEGATGDYGTTAATSGSAYGWSGNQNYRTGRNIYCAASTMQLTTNVQRFMLGVTDQTAATMGGAANPAGNYAMFRWDTSVPEVNGHWSCVTKDGTTQTVIDSGKSADQSRHVFEITFNDAVPNVVFYIDGAVVGTSTTHLPSSGINLRMFEGGQTLENATKDLRIEWFVVKSDL